VNVATDELHRVARSAGVIGGATLASRVLGLVRDVVLANVFAVRVTDAFFVAFTIPNLFRRLVGEGTLTAAFVPIFTGQLQAGSAEEARRAFNATWTLAAGVGVGISIVGVVFADPLVRVFAPGFLDDPAKFELCVLLLRICFPYILLLSVFAVAMGALNATGHFFAPAIAPVLLNVCIIAAALGGLGAAEPIVWVSISVLVAGVVQVLAQFPPLRARSLSPRPLFEPGHPVVRRLLTVMAPAVLGASVYQFNLLVVRFLSSFLGDGAVSYLFYADRLLEFPLGVFVFAIGTASLPSLSRLVKRGESTALSRAFSETMAFAVALALPSTLGLIWLREPLVAGLFAWTPTFDAAAIAGCAHALLFYALGLVPITVSRICVQLCFSHENTRTPAQAAVVSLAVNVVAALALIGPLPASVLPDALVDLQHRLVLFDLGYAGLALATSLAAAANAVFLVAYCRVSYGVFRPGADALRWLRIGVAGGVMATALSLSSALLPAVRGASLAGLAQLALQVALGAGVYFASLALLRSPEMRAFRALLGRG
jgi:putative peptidoglycan lipid II flippase